MRESEIVSKILQYLKTLPECFYWKEHGGPYGTNGIPDIIICCQGRFIALEVKTPSGRPTALQQAVIRKITRAGGKAHIVRSVDEVRQIISQCIRKETNP